MKEEPNPDRTQGCLPADRANNRRSPHTPLRWRGEAQQTLLVSWPIAVYLVTHYEAGVTLPARGGGVVYRRMPKS